MKNLIRGHRYRIMLLSLKRSSWRRCFSQKLSAGGPPLNDIDDSTSSPFDTDWRDSIPEKEGSSYDLAYNDNGGKTSSLCDTDWRDSIPEKKESRDDLALLQYKLL